MNKESAFAPSLAGVSNLEFPLHPQNPRLDVRHGGHPLGLVHPGQTEDGHWSRRQGHVEGERTPSATVSRYHPGQWVLAFPGIRGLERAVRLARDRRRRHSRYRSRCNGGPDAACGKHPPVLNACLHRAKRPCAATYLPHFGSTGFTFITATSRLLKR